MTHPPPQPSALRSFGLLAADALRDSVRSRMALWASLAGLLALYGAERCTGAGGSFSVNGHSLDPADVARVIGPLGFALVALLGVAVAGIVSADALARPIADGSVGVWLARPVSRGVYAAARLAGAFGASLAAGAVVLGGAGLLLHLRQGLSFWPALAGIAAFALDALVVCALAMTASLFLPRVATSFAVMLWIQLAAAVDAAHLIGVSLGGWLGALERHGPPLGTALLYAIAPWLSLELDPAGAVATGVRLAAWAAAAIALLLLCFRRLELPR